MTPARARLHAPVEPGGSNASPFTRCTHQLSKRKDNVRHNGRQDPARTNQRHSAPAATTLPPTGRDGRHRLCVGAQVGDGLGGGASHFVSTTLHGAHTTNRATRKRRPTSLHSEGVPLIARHHRDNARESPASTADGPPTTRSPWQHGGSWSNHHLWRLPREFWPSSASLRFGCLGRRERGLHRHSVHVGVLLLHRTVLHHNEVHQVDVNRSTGHGRPGQLPLDDPEILTRAERHELEGQVRNGTRANIPAAASRMASRPHTGA